MLRSNFKCLKIKNLNEIGKYGQSIWLDFLDRNVMEPGRLQNYINEDGIKDLTSNPAIFKKAITGSKVYKNDLAKFSEDYDRGRRFIFAIAAKDIQWAADIFRLIHDTTNAMDEYVSLEVSPYLAKDTEGTVSQDNELWPRCIGKT